MKKGDDNIVRGATLVGLPLVALCCYHQFEKGMFNFYQMPFDFFDTGTDDLIIAICTFVIAVGLSRLLSTHALFSLIALLFVAIILTPALGYKAAALKTNYAIYTKDPEYFLVGRDNNFYILKEFDEKSHHIGRNTMLLSIQKTYDVSFTIKEIGRLKTD